MDLKSVEVLILDEADRLLDMGFSQQVDSLMRRLPKQRRTGLFSATQTKAVEALARAGLRNPVRVAVAVSTAGNDSTGRGEGKSKSQAVNETSGGTQPQTNNNEQITPNTLAIHYTVADTAADKLALLTGFLATHGRSEKLIVYFFTCACVDYFSTILPRLLGSSGGRSGSTDSPVQLHALHGRMKQSARESTLTSFAQATTGVLLATDVAARGLDIPDVHWVVQYDAPQDPSAFVHRCGRTARMGRSGSALALLTPSELAYVDFLRLRKVPLTEYELSKDEKTNIMDTKEIVRIVRKESEGDRVVMDTGVKAFVSYIRAYKEHHCKYIFRLEDVALGPLASSFALLRLPKMPEVKKAARTLAAQGSLDALFTSSDVDPDTVKFKDKLREKQRQQVLAQRAAAAAAGEEGNKRNKDSTAAAQNKKKKKNNDSIISTIEQPRLTAAKRRQLEARQEVEDLNDEYALLKKLKRGKISEKEYNTAAGLNHFLDDDDGDDDDEGGDGVGGARQHHNQEVGVLHKKKKNLVEQAMAKKARKKAKKINKRQNITAAT